MYKSQIPSLYKILHCPLTSRFLCCYCYRRHRISFVPCYFGCVCRSNKYGCDTPSYVTEYTTSTTEGNFLRRLDSIQSALRRAFSQWDNINLQNLVPCFQVPEQEEVSLRIFFVSFLFTKPMLNAQHIVISYLIFKTLLREDGKQSGYLSLNFLNLPESIHCYF